MLAPGVGRPGELAGRDRRALLALGIFAAVLPLLLGAAALWLAWAPRAPQGAVPVRSSVPAYLPPVVSNEAIFGIIGFKLGRLVRALTTPEDVEAWLASHPGMPIVIRMEQFWRLPPELRRRLRFVYDERGRKAAPFGIAVEASAQDMQNRR